MSRSFDRSVEKLLKTEGGYSNLSSDPGGETKYGITEEVAKENGYEGDMKKLPREEAVEIYRKNYWNKNNLDKVAGYNEALAYEIFDTSVNMGQKTAVKFFQRALNVFNKQGEIFDDLKVDGIIGDKTLDALKNFHRERNRAEGTGVLTRAIVGQKTSMYIRLAEENEELETFVYGWIANRT